MTSKRIYLSPPHMSGAELEYVRQAFEDNWIAPVGPQLKQFEQRMGAYTGAEHCLGVSSGTGGIHLALMALGVGPGDAVWVSTLTFAGSVNPILYVGATPVFIDSDTASWNLDPALLAQALSEAEQNGTLPKVLIVVDLYGQAADMDPIVALCQQYGVKIIEDAAEALGTTYKGRHVGTFGDIGVFSFNGNKIITTSGGGMVASNDADLVDRMMKLATQAREPVVHYEHHEVGYNYRMSNIVAAIGCGQLEVIEERVERKQAIYDFYCDQLGDLPGLTFVPAMSYGRHNRWLSVVLVDSTVSQIDPETIRLELEKHNVESRPLWKPMHQQPVFSGCKTIGGAVADRLFAQGLCLPSGTALTDAQIGSIVDVVRSLY